MKTNKIIKFLKAYYNNLSPILFFLIIFVLFRHNVYSIKMIVEYNNYWHIAINILLWVGLKTYYNCDYYNY